MSWFDRLMGSSGVDQNDDYIRQIDGAAAAEAAAQAEAAANDNAWKYLSVGDLLGLSDYTNRNYSYRMIPFLGQIVGHASDAATQGVADVAQFLGAQGISDYLNEKAQKGEEKLPAMSKPEASLAYLTDPNGLASAFGMMGGSFLSMAPMAVIAPELLPARAAAVLSRVPKALSAVPKIGGALEEMAPMAGRFALTGPIEAMMEGGNTEREMLRNGATPEEARQAAWDVFNENVGLLTATNALEGGLLGKLKIKTPKFSNPVVNTASRAAGYIPTTAAEMALQGYEEGAQQGIQNGVEGQSPNTANQILNPFAWTDAQLDAAKMGIAGAAPLMGAMGVARHFGNRQAQDAQTQAVNDAIRAQQAEADAEFAPVSFGDTDVSAPEIAAPKGQVRKAGTDVLAAAQDYMGQHMGNGENGCVEAVTKIGANYNSFLADELGRGVVNVDTLVKDAGDSVVPFDASNVQAGDVIVYGDNDHVVIADGNGGYVGNSSSKQVVVQGDDYNEMGGLKPTKIIKTGSDTASSTGSGQGSADLSGLAGGGIASAIAQRTGLPANLIWAQLAHESDDFSSQLAREDHNYGGITNSDGSYRHFDSDEDFVDFMANYYPKYKENGLYDARNADEWASALKDGGYFTADLGEYEGGMKRHLADAGLPDGAMPGDNMKGEAASVGIPDLDTLLGNADAGDDFTKGFYQGAADYILNTAVDEDAISAVSQMTNRKGDFKNTKENRLALATKFADELADYYDTLSANLAQNAPQAAGQPASAPQVQSAARSAETPHIEKAETPAIDKAKAQQNMRTNTSFRMEDAPQAGQADAQEMQIARSLAPKMQQAIFRTARNIAVGMQARGQENTQDFMRLRDAIQRRDYGAMMQMYPQEMQSAVAPIVQRGMEELSAKPQKPVQTGKPAAQIAQGRNLIQLAQQNHVSLPSGMVRYLNAGHQKAIDAAEERLQQAGVPLTEMKGVEENETNQRTENQAAPRSEAAGDPYQNAESGKGRADAEESEVAPSPHFDTSDFQHTKTGEMIPAAKATERTSKEDFASLKSIAKQNGGYYNRFAKRFLFEDEAGRDAFAQAAEREVFGGAQPLVADHVETAVPVAAAAQEQRATQTSLQEQTDGKREAAEPEGKQLAEIIQKHPEQADAYRVALAGAPDYHGFLDDLRPGAIRQIRSVLEAVGSPFGAGKGSMPVKRLMESLARSPYTKESTKETSSGAVQYMLNGNRVPKAAYRYYQHLKSIGYSEGQDGKEKAGEPKTLAPGYRTESGKPLSKAGEKEFILKPNGSKDFGEITGAISRAAKEQSGVDLAPGKIRLHVGNDKEGLLHAKKHEEQAKADGYASIEDMVADVAENFDSIYAHGLTGDGHTTYSLIKHGNKATGKMNGVAPVYLNLEDDGHGNYYVIVTAIPKGDANLARQTKKDRLIYSSPGLGAATESNAGAVSTSAKNVGAETRGGTPASDKSSGSSTPSVAQEQESGKKNIAYTDGSFSDKTKNDNAMRGTVKNGVMTIWRKSDKKKDTPIITVSVDEVNRELKKGSANSEYTLHQLAKHKFYVAMEVWIEGAKDPELRQKRRDYWEEDKLYPSEDRAIDSAVRVIKELYETATGEPPRSPWEKHQEAKKNAPETRAEEHESGKGMADAIISDPAWKKLEGQLTESGKRKIRDELPSIVSDFEERNGLVVGHPVSPARMAFLSLDEDFVESPKTFKKRSAKWASFNKEVTSIIESHINKSQEDNSKESQESAAQEEGSKKNAAKDGSIFGSVEDADREMLDALGISEDDLQEEVLEAPPGISNTAEERERLEKELAAELNKIFANPVFNPKIYTLGLKLAMTYVKDGYNTFKKLVTKLHTAFGDKIGPWAPALAETVRTWPKGVPFDEKKVMAISKAVGARYEGGITSLDEMQDDMKKLLKGQHKSFAPMIEASYNGIRKFFDEKEAQEHGDESRQETGESPDAGREGRQSAASEGAGEGRLEPGGVSGAEGGNREVTRGGNPGRSERENPERSESSGVRAGAELETTASAGDRERGSEKSVLTEGQAHPSPEETPGHDYEIKPSKTKKTPAVRFRQNIDALKLLKQLEADDRMPTPKEQTVLGNYNGWGGLKEAFLDTKMNKELRAVLTPEEYKAAQSTVNDAFYTPANIVRAVWKGVSRLGFTGGRVLDPSMGVGNFFGCMPRDMMKSSSLRGIEIDDLTSRLARMLYPSALVEHTGFEKAQLADNFYDLVISNIPFDGNHSIAGYKIHNYFFAHGMDKVRPGGLMVYITSQGSLTNSQDGARMRDYIGKKADMVAAYKLPSGAFGEAGTSVGTDIVIFRKRGEHEMKPDYARDFQRVGKMFTYSDNSGGVPVNEYFKAHPENIIGEASKGRDQYGNDVLLVKPKEGADVAKELSKAMNKLPKDVYEPVNRTGEDSFDSIKANIKLRANDKRNHDLEYWEKDGKIYQNRYRDNAGIMAKEVPAGKKLTRLKGYLKIRSALNSLMLAEMDPEAKETTVSHLRKQLNTVYDAYVKKNGYLNDPQGQRAYIDDPSSGMVMALEKVTYTGFGAKKKIEKAEKTAIFKERTISPIKEVTSVDSPNDALLVSLRNKGRVDLPYMAKLMGSTPETVAAGLGGQIFKNPATERYETRDEYLSGNVREKLAQAENAATQDPSYQKNADALRKVVPEDLIPDEICVTMGAPWIPASDVQAFADHITGRAGSLSVKFIPSNAKWVVDGYGHSGKYEAKGIDLSDLLSDILNNKAIEIYSGRGENRTLDREATDAANVIAGDMKEDFRTWLWSDKARAKRLARYYNDNYNNTVLREYDGSHLTFPGHNEKIELKPHQKNVVWRMLQGGNTLIAHCVGAGKTFEMQAAGMEMRRLGIANKPLYILPNNVVEQFTKEFYELYPNARLLVLQNDSKTRPGYIPAVPKSTIEQKVKREDGRTEIVTIPFGKLSAADRKKVTEARALRTRTLAQIKTEDWDGIVMSHSQFERLPLSPETAASFIEEQLDEVEQAITEAKEGKVDKRTLGTIENQKKKLEENLDAVMKTDPRDIGVPFEQLGIDQIFVDEADMFKNLHYTTSMDRVNGLPNSNANRSMDMYAKTRWLTNANGGRGVVFATGTPVSNTMAEMFTMMRYLDFQGLKEKGLHLFDNWLRTFGEIGSGIERNPSGSGFRKVNKVLRFINMPELTKMFRKFADVKTQDDLDLDIPKLKNGKPTIVKIAPDPVLTNYIKKEVPRRIANMAKRREDMRKGADNMLALTGDLRKMSITDSKIDALADEVAKKYEETTDVKGAQLIFCDQGIPKAEKDNAKESDTESDDGTETENASVYGKIIESLEERGVPKEQIVFIQSAKNKAQMEEIFKKVDSGDIRILIGSTQKMGAGTNCQHHLVALHDLDAPWRPRDLEQRHGRILRQGNPNKEVEIFNYVLQDSFDPIMWEKLKNKASIVAQAMSSNMQQRTVEDADLVTLTYADAENAGTSDPLVKERIALDSEIKKYKHAQVAFHRKMSEAEHTVETAPKKIEELKDAVAKIKDDMGVRQDTRGDKFRMTISGREYTERKEAQAALGDTLAELTSKSSMKIGEISGFDIKAYAGNDGQPHIQLVRKRAYMANTATVAGIENALRKAPETLLGDREEELREKEESLKTAKEVIGQTNPYAEKLAGMEKRFKEINRQIEDNMLGKADDSKEESETPDEAYSVEEQAAAKERAIDDLKREVRDALPGAHSIEDKGDTVSFTMPNGARVQVLLSPSIELNDTSAAKARAAHGVKPEARLRINGRERTVGQAALIELSQLGRTGSAYHETFHAVYDMCLTDKERAALHKAYDKEAKATGRDVLEVMADKYRDWKLAKQKGQHVPFGKLWQKIKDAAGRLLRVIRGTDHASDVFRRVESGEAWERPARTGNQKKYSVEGVENPGEADYNEDRLSDSQKEMLFDSVKRVFDSQVKVLKQHGITEDEINAELTAHNSEQRTKALAGLKATYNQLHAKGLNQEGKREIVERISGNKNLSNAQISALFTKLKTYSEEAVDYAGVIYRELAVHRRGDYGNASQVLTWRDIDRFRGIAERKENNINESRSDIRDGFSSAQNPMHYSAEAEEAPKSFAKKAFLKFAKRSHIKGEKIVVEEQNDAKPTMNLTNYVLSSPSRIADKVQAFRLFYRMGTRAMDTLTKHRSDYARKLGEAMDFVKKKSDRQALYEILLNGDAEGKEYTRQELADDGISDNVIEAYTRIRRLMTKAYRMVDDAHRRPKVVSKRMTDKKIAELRENHFVEILRVGTKEDDGRRLVTYKEYANHEKVYKGIDDDTFRRFREDDSIQILADRGNDDGTFDVKVREGISHMNRLGGYIPHFFHDYMIRVKDSDGGYVTTLGSGRTEREAVKKAEAYLKEHALPEGQKIYISPKVMDFTTLGMSEQQYGAIMGDKDYFRMLSSIAKNNDLAYEDAKALIEGSARMKNRHRFFGNAMHRTGVKGYETDLGWVLRHYFNSASRYAALETEFKPQAISLYERLYGDFNHDAPSKEADYTKDYINDINGNPSTLEIAINEALMKSKWFRQFIVPRFGDRAALTLSSKLSNAVSYMCLGYFNTSSAFLNLTQVMNSAAYIGDVSALAKCIAKGAHRKYSMHDLKILVETNVLNDIGLDSGSGYDMNRMSAKSLLGKLNRGGMWMLKTSEGIVRRGTVLAAYEAGRKRGMTHEEAIAFAKDVNRKSNFDYGVSDAPNIFRRGSIVSQLALQFKKYGIKELEVMADMFPTNSKTSRKQKAIFWGTYFLTAGLMGLPMLDFFDKWPFDGKLKLSVEECLMEAAGGDPLGKKLATAALFGVAAAVPGIDLSNRAGLSDVIPTRGSDLMGATLSKTANLISDSLKGNGMSAIRDVSPGIYNIVAAARGYSEGKRGRVNDRYNTFYDRVLRAMGFKSTDERVNSDIDRIVNIRKSKEAQEKQDAIDAYLENPSTENAGRLKALGVKPKAVADERKKKQQSRRERTQSGMSKPKQQENERLMQFGD